VFLTAPPKTVKTIFWRAYSYFSRQVGLTMRGAWLVPKHWGKRRGMTPAKNSTIYANKCAQIIGFSLYRAVFCCHVVHPFRRSKMGELFLLCIPITFLSNIKIQIFGTWSNLRRDCNNHERQRGMSEGVGERGVSACAVPVRHGDREAGKVRVRKLG